MVLTDGKALSSVCTCVMTGVKEHSQKKDWQSERRREEQDLCGSCDEEETANGMLLTGLYLM